MVSLGGSRTIVGVPSHCMWRREHIGEHRFSRLRCVHPSRCVGVNRLIGPVGEAGKGRRTLSDSNRTLLLCLQTHTPGSWSRSSRTLTPRSLPAAARLRARTAVNAYLSKKSCSGPGGEERRLGLNGGGLSFSICMSLASTSHEPRGCKNKRGNLPPSWARLS